MGGIQIGFHYWEILEKHWKESNDEKELPSSCLLVLANVAIDAVVWRINGFQLNCIFQHPPKHPSNISSEVAAGTHPFLRDVSSARLVLWLYKF